MVLSGLGVACVFPQLSSVGAQPLPTNRTGVGGAAPQAVGQFGATFGVALTIGFLGTSMSLTDALAGFDRIWWLLVAGGLITSLLTIPTRTTLIGATPEQRPRAHAEGR